MDDYIMIIICFLMLYIAKLTPEDANFSTFHVCEALTQNSVSSPYPAPLRRPAEKN